MKLHRLFVLLILGVMGSGCGERIEPAPTPTIPTMPAPHFELLDLQGNKVSSDSFQGKIVILNFWASWSPGSVREIPEWVALQREFLDDGVVFVGINVDQEGIVVAQPYAEKRKINYPILLGNTDMGADFGGLDGIPSTFIIDREWNLINRYTGLTSAASIRSEIRAMLMLDRQKARNGVMPPPETKPAGEEGGPSPDAPAVEEKKEPEPAPAPEPAVKTITEPVEI